MELISSSDSSGGLPKGPAMLSGLSAFPLTPLDGGRVDEFVFVQLIERLVRAEVDSMGVLGSTGSYAYLSHAERVRVSQLAIGHSEGVPVMIGISALSTRDALALAADAQKAGAQGVLLSPMSYQKLTDDEVFGLYKAVTQELSVPLCVYDNPATTQFTFTDELHGRIAQLPNVASIKIPGVPTDPAAARERIQRLRSFIPSHVTIGVSGDAGAVVGLNAGCEAWYSVIGGLFPKLAVAITRAAQAGRASEASARHDRLAPLWELFLQHGSLRVVATMAELCGLVARPALPAPLRALEGDARRRLEVVLHDLGDLT